MPVKNLVLIFLFFQVTACNLSTENSSRLQAEIDSLRHQLSETYTPGLGEFMSGIQIHHAKLWFAGISKNWELTDFEIKEIREAIENIRKFNLDRSEINSIGIIIPAIDSVSHVIRQQNVQSFESGYQFLTNTYNACHQTTNHEFNVIVVPASPPVSNQLFEPVQ